MWKNYDDDYESDDIEDSDNCDNWEVRIGKSSEMFETKDGAINYLLEEMNDMCNEKLYENTTLIGFADDE